MTSVTTNTTVVHKPIFPGLAAGFARMYRAMVASSQGARGLAHARKLDALTDEQLAAKGLRRDQIVRHSFQHLMHL